MVGSPTTAAASGRNASEPGARGGGRGGDSGLLALLCLYLVLLAFFILLNAMAQPDERRQRDVLASVHEAFDRNQGAVLPPLREAARAPADETAAAVLAGALSALLGDLARVEVEEEGRSASALRLRLDAALLFEPRSAAPRPELGALLDTTAAALAEPPLSELHVEVEIRHELESLAADRQRAELAIGRSGAMVRALAERQVPADRLGAGVSLGQDDRIQVVFRLYRERPAALDLSAAGSAQP